MEKPPTEWLVPGAVITQVVNGWKYQWVDGEWVALRTDAPQLPKEVS